MNFSNVRKQKLASVSFFVMFITLFISCAERDPGIITFPDPAFKDPTLVLEGSAGNFVKVDIYKFNQDVTLTVNGIAVDLSHYGGNSEYSTMGFYVPAKCGSGPIEMKYDGKVFQGPQFKYLPIYVSTSIFADSRGFCHFQGNSFLTWSPFSKSFSKIKFKEFTSKTGFPANANFTYTQYKPTLPAGNIFNISYFTGIAINSQEHVFFYQQYEVTGVRQHKIMVSNFDWVVENVGSHSQPVVDIELDAADNIYSIGIDQPYITKTNQSGSSIFVGSATAGHADGTGINARFNVVRATAIDKNGNLYVADKNSVRMVTNQGVVTTLAGTTEAGDVIGASSQARFNTIMGIYVKDDGIIYVVDGGNKKVKTISSDRSKVESLPISFTPSVDDKLNTPLFVDSNNIVYINSRKEGTIYAFIPEEMMPAQFFDPATSFYQSNLVIE